MFKHSRCQILKQQEPFRQIKRSLKFNIQLTTARLEGQGCYYTFTHQQFSAEASLLCQTVNKIW